MPVLEVLIYGHPFLRKKVNEVKCPDETISELAENMIETIKFYEGVGLAAPQAGYDMRLIVIDAGAVSDEHIFHPRVLINPHILSAEGQNIFREGCLSIPGIYADVKRPETVTVQFQDLKGGTHLASYSGVEARIIQHEVDHLNGILFIDHLNPIKRWLLKGKLSNLRKRAATVHFTPNEKSLKA